MEKSILMSIKPEWLVKILNGEKTIELRKKFPKDFKGWVYLYCTKGGKLAIIRSAFRHAFRLDTCYFDDYEINLSGKVVARFWCDRVDTIVRRWNGWGVEDKDVAYNNELAIRSCLDCQDLDDYLKDKEGKAIHISKLEIFNKPKELSEFYKRLGCSNCTGIDTCPNPKRWGDRLTKAPQSWQYIYVKE